MSADFEMGCGGFLVGAMAGTALTVGAAAGQAVRDVARQQRTLTTIGRWQDALAQMKSRAIRAERHAARLAFDNEQLRDRLAAAELELSILRSASA